MFEEAEERSREIHKKEIVGSTRNMAEFTLPLSDRAERLLKAQPLKYIMALIPHIGPELTLV